MKTALSLARRGLDRTSPNPMVGAIIVRDGRVIGRGYHRRFGGKHAEVNAIESATEDVAGATMYVTLEPCCHHGKTPPCTDAVIRHRIGRVVIGMSDPDPRVSGRSIGILHEHGIETTAGVLEDACRSLNEAYVRHRSTGVPFVTVKFAQTLDGRIATATGHSQWISSPESRKLAHTLRARSDAVVVGIGTVLADDPELTVRHVRGRNPIRIVLDSKLRVPLDARIVTGKDAAATIIATTPAADDTKLADLRERGIEVMTVAADILGGIDIARLLPALGRRDITSVLVEGGSRTITSFLRLGLADRLVAFVAPKIIGSGTETVGDLDIATIDRAITITFERTYRLGGDLVIEARLNEGKDGEGHRP